MNSDNTPELFWVRADHSIVAIFTCRNGQVVLLDAYWSRYRACINRDRQLFTRGSSGAADNYSDFLSLTDKGQLVPSYRFYSTSSTGTVTYHEYTHEETTQITEEALLALCEAYSWEESPFWLELPISVF